MVTLYRSSFLVFVCFSNRTRDCNNTTYFVHYSGTSGCEFTSFGDGVCKVIYSDAEARFTCKWSNSFQFAQTQSYKLGILYPPRKKLHIISTYSMIHM